MNLKCHANPMKILFVSRKYDQVVGGVERMSIAIMNEMVRRGHKVGLLSWDSKSAQTYYSLNNAVTWYKLSVGDPTRKASFFEKLLRLIKARTFLKRYKPDVIICFQDGPFRSVLQYSKGLGIPIIAAERNAPSRFKHTSGGVRSEQVFKSFQQANKITVQCEGYKDKYPKDLRPKISCIPNPVKTAEKFATPGERTSPKILLSVGRLDYQKNYDVLLKAFQNLAYTHPDWNLHLAGDGEDRAKLEAYISQHDLSDRVVLHGSVSDVESLYTQSHLFCLPSRWEGFPNALAEALAHGLPSIGYAGCDGINELIRDGENGRLAYGNDNVETLVNVLDELMANDTKRQAMSQSAIRSVEAYGPDKIFDQWDALFRESAAQ